MSIQIFLTDDDKDDRELFGEALAEIDDTIIFKALPDAEATLNELELGQIPDVLILDVNLPVISGWECLSRIKSKEHLKHIPVIIFSTSSFGQDEQTARQRGACCFITKPHSYARLKEILATVVDLLRSKQPERLSQAMNYTRG